MSAADLNQDKATNTSSSTPPTPMNDTQPTGLDLDSIIDELFGAGLVRGGLYEKGEPGGTITSDALFRAKQALTRWGLEQRIDELSMALEASKADGFPEDMLDVCSWIIKRLTILDPKFGAELQANLQQGRQHG